MNDETKQTCLDRLVVKFHELVATGPTYVCVCCDQLWYEHSVVRAEVLRYLENEVVSKCLPNRWECCAKEWVCKTCSHHIKKNKIPPCAVQNKMGFPYKPEFLDLSDLEWRLVSPRLIFQKIHEAARGKQLKIHGNVVNVPADVANTANVLPRVSTQTETIKVQLKRKLMYKHYVLSQNIRPFKVFEAAKWLTENGTLFRQQSIKLNPHWTDLATSCKESDIDKDNPCSSLMSVGATISKIGTVEQTVSPDPEFSFDITKAFICLQCEQVVSDDLHLERHLLDCHGVEINCDSFDETNSVIFYHSDCNNSEVVYFCCLCSAWEKEQSLFTKHMTALVKKPPGSWRDPAMNPDPRRDPARIMPALVFSRQNPVRKKIPP